MVRLHGNDGVVLDVRGGCLDMRFICSMRVTVEVVFLIMNKIKQ